MTTPVLWLMLLFLVNETELTTALTTSLDVVTTNTHLGGKTAPNDTPAGKSHNPVTTPPPTTPVETAPPDVTTADGVTTADTTPATRLHRASDCPPPSVFEEGPVTLHTCIGNRTFEGGQCKCPEGMFQHYTECLEGCSCFHESSATLDCNTCACVDEVTSCQTPENIERCVCPDIDHRKLPPWYYYRSLCWYQNAYEHARCTRQCHIAFGDRSVAGACIGHRDPYPSDVIVIPPGFSMDPNSTSRHGVSRRSTGYRWRLNYYDCVCRVCRI